MTVSESVDSDDGVVVDAAYLQRVMSETLRGSGAVEADARTQAQLLIEGDLRGQHSHGVRRLPILVARLERGLVSSGLPQSMEWVTDSVVRVDGRRGFGPVVAFAAIDAAVERAERTGIALATVGNSNHIGMLAPYVERMAGAGHVGIALTTSEALVHPWGGASAMVGTNPIGIAVPTADEPLVLDMSTAAVSMGKILDLAGRNRPIPPGWAVDEFGEPTTDAIAASRGALAPLGGQKGYALGIALEVLVALLSRSAIGTEVRGTLDSEEVCSKGDIFISISLRRLGIPRSGIAQVTAYLETVRASAQLDSNPPRIPGDRARHLRQQRLTEGIPLDREVWSKTLRMHRKAGYV